MIPPLPANIGFSWLAMPFGQWVPVAPDPEPCPPDPQAAETTPEPVAMRWEFKGYQWQPLALWVPFVNPGWDHVVDNDPDEIRDRAERQEQERRSMEAHAAKRADAAICSLPRGAGEGWGEGER
ncbi:hypothetical protein [Piscinibacter sp. XHJ-5]|uniref:hypothetical protein n=1 Tax=Piscinibacter sp. XHJ-5 TaxID=3037797 RepID=UPI0024528490|nr:hypothetical protein [Piscinibacter sp. XHJ-5]